jgi:mannitol-specific phosphotransferase system IIBC component
MRTQHKVFAFFIPTFVAMAISVGSAIVASRAIAQDDNSPSLGDLARQQRQKKAQSKTAQAKDNKESKVYTNADLPAGADPKSGNAPDRPGDSAAQATDLGKSGMPTSAAEAGQGSEQMRSQILEQKNQIAELQKQIDDVNESIRFAPGNCVRNCEQWNERQQEKQQQVQQMQAQLDELKKQLEEMQESARKQGFGSSVYDP